MIRQVKEYKGIYSVSIPKEIVEFRGIEKYGLVEFEIKNIKKQKK